MTGSSLATKTIPTSHYSSRGGAKIDRIIIHHMAGNLSIEQCGAVFQNREASAHYGIGSDGRIAQYVDEDYRAWSVANAYGDSRAITMELANDVVGGSYHVSDAAIESCINLCVDICKRNGISKLNYTGNLNGNLHMHRMYMSTTCPGDYLASKFGYIANEVNKRLENYTMGDWIKDKGGWWFRNPDGSYPVKGWKKINGIWYFFDGNGYAIANKWLSDTGKWYYFDSDCKMVTDRWCFHKNKWYYLGADGAMVSDTFVKYKGEWYYIGADGAMLENMDLKLHLDKTGVITF